MPLFGPAVSAGATAPPRRLTRSGCYFVPTVTVDGRQPFCVLIESGERQGWAGWVTATPLFMAESVPSASLSQPASPATVTTAPIESKA